MIKKIKKIFNRNKGKADRWAGVSLIPPALLQKGSGNAGFYSNMKCSLPINFIEREEINNLISNLDIVNIIILYGMGGIGKTTILTKMCNSGLKYKIAYYDLKNKPSFLSIGKSILRELFDEMILSDIESEIVDKIADYMIKDKVIIILDNLESIMDVGENDGKIHQDFKGFEMLINKILPLTLKSTLILSGREKLELGSRYVDQCYFHKLHGLSVEQAKNLLQNFELKGSHTDWKNFVEKYSGNVLSLKIVATEICNRCQKNIGKFLMSPHIPHELNDLLDEQFSRFSTIEKVLLYWCSVKREPVTFEYLKNKIVGFNNSNEYLYEAIDNILDHCFLDSFEFEEEGYYQLQPVIMEFLTKKLISSIINEINNGKSEYLNYVGLIDTVAKEYILEVQKSLLLKPLCDSLLNIYSLRECDYKLNLILEKLDDKKFYTVGNIITILSAYHETIVEWNFSNKFILNADFRNIKTMNCDFSNSTFENVLFKNTFGNLIDVKFSYDDKLIIGGATDYSINGWNSYDLSFEFKKINHSDWVRSVDSNKKYLVSGSNDETINIYDYSNKNFIKSFVTNSRVRKVKLRENIEDSVYSSGDDGIIKKWDILSGKCKTIGAHSKVVWDFELISINNINYVISISDDSKVMLWNELTLTGECIYENECDIESVVFDGEDRIYLGCGNGKIKVISLAKKQIIESVNAHEGIVWGLDYDKNNDKLLSGSSDRHIIIWNCQEKLEQEKVIEAHNSTIWNVNYDSKGTKFVTTGDDYEFKVWDAVSYLVIYSVKGYTNLLRNIYVSDELNSLFVGGDDMIIRKYSIDQSDYAEKFFIGHTNRVRHIDISKNGQYMLSCGDDGKVILWNLLTGEHTIYYGHQKRVWAVSFVGEKHFVSAGEENDIYYWEIGKTLPIKYLKNNESWVWDLTYNEHSNLLISAGEDNTCRIWDMNIMTEKVCLNYHNKWLFAATISDDSKYVLTSSADNTAKIIDITRNKEICCLEGHQGWVWSAIFLENDLVATGSQDGTIKIWKVNYLEEEVSCIKTIYAHKSWVVSLQYSKKYKKIYSASADEKVKIWNLDKLEYCGEFFIDKPYDKMKITSVKGITLSEKESLIKLGSIQ